MRVVAIKRDTRELSTCAENKHYMRIQPKLQVKHVQLESLETNPDGKGREHRPLSRNLPSLWGFLRAAQA